MNFLCICSTATVAEMETEITQNLLPYAGYVEQFDTLVDTLTCQEMLLYTAQLKRPCSEPLAAKQAAVEVLLSKLCLSTCANTQIGSYLKRGISGGQAKRLNIGIALITDPRVLFLDGESHSSSCQRCRAESIVPGAGRIVCPCITAVACALCMRSQAPYTSKNGFLQRWFCLYSHMQLFDTLQPVQRQDPADC